MLAFSYCMPGTCPLAALAACPLTDATSLLRRAEILIIVSSKSKSTCYIVELLIFELLLLFVLFWFHNRNVLKLMIELISAAKVGKISETDVSLPEKVVSNQEKCVSERKCQEPVPWQA